MECKCRIGNTTTLLLIVVVPVILYVTQYIYINVKNASDMFYLVFSNPSVSSIFLSNYVHLNADHLLQNTVLFVMVVSVIIATENYVIPRLTRDEKLCLFTEHTFIISSALYFTIGAFIISILSCAFYSGSDVIGGVGFSGVVAMFGGYYVYLMRGIVIYKAFEGLKNRDIVSFYYGSIISYAIPVFVTISIAMASIDTGTNIIAHTVGFVIGLAIPYLVD